MKALPLDPNAAGMALHLALRDRFNGALREFDTLEAIDLYLTAVTVVRHFKASEIVQLSTYNGVRNGVPVPQLWPNIVPTLLVCEWLRSEFDKPVLINSGYRSEAYNDAVGGAPESMHRKFNALDIRIDGIAPDDVAAKLEEHTDAHLFGLGRYETFTHMDTRGMLGMSKARW